MRITNSMLVNNMIGYMGNNLSRMEKLQNQLATGKKIQVPSDDPVVAARALKLRTDVSEINQYKSNTKDAMSWLDITETALGNMGEILHRAKELAVQGSNGTFSDADMKATAKEVEQLKNQLIHIANTTISGRSIFTGYQTDKTLIKDDGTFAIDVGSAENIKYEIGIGDDINVNILGGDLFNHGGTATVNTTGRLIQDFSNFVNALNAGNTAGIGAIASNLEEDMDNVLKIRSDIGARQNRLELTSNRLDGDYVNFTKLMSENEDVDEAETIMNLKNEENVYRASLAGGARIIQPSLVDFLR